MEGGNFITKDIAKDWLIKILSDYYSALYHRNISIKANVRIVDNDNFDLNIYFEQFSLGTIQIVNLTYEDIRKCLEVYANNLGYTLDSFKYIGGIRHVGYFTEEDTPHFEGVRLYLKEKSKIKIKK